MKNKIVMITALLAVMVAMTGIAAAVGVNTVEETIRIQYGSSAIAHIYWSYGTDHTDKIIRWELRDMTNTITTDLSGDDGDGSQNPGQETVSYDTSVDGSGLNAFALTITDDLATSVTRNYKLYACLALADGTCNMQFVKDVTIPVDTVPEFATVAIPIAAVLGLVFFFQQKKNKKE